MKLSRKVIPIGAGWLLALPLAVCAQTAAKSPTPVQASVGEVTDNRSTVSAFAQCKVELRFTGDAAADAGTVRQVHITDAVDELGRDLKLKNDDDMASRLFNPGHSGGALKTEVKLRNPSRNATTLKILKGQVELFSPTEANGSILRIQGVLKHPAEAIPNPVLAKYKIQLMYLTKESYEAKKKEIEAQQSAGGGAAGQKLGEGFRELFGGMFGGMVSSSKDAVQLYLKDPDKRIVEMEFQDAAGKPLQTRSKWTSNDFQQTELAAPPPVDTQLVIQLAVPEAVQTFPFEIHDIPLP